MYFTFAFLFLFFETLIIGWILRQKNNKIEFYYLTIYFFTKCFRLNLYRSNIQFLNNSM